MPRDAADDIVRIHIFLEKHKFEIADPRADLNDDGTRKADGKNAAASIDFYYVSADNIGPPTVFSIRREPGSELLPLPVLLPKPHHVACPTQPKAFTKDHVDTLYATWGDPVALDTSNADITKITPGLVGSVPLTEIEISGFIATGRDHKGCIKYVLTITPKYESTERHRRQKSKILKAIWKNLSAEKVYRPREGKLITDRGYG